MAVVPKPKLSTQVDLKKVFESDSNPKNSPERDQKVQNGPKFGQIEHKKQDCTFKTNIDSLYQQVPKMF